MLLAAPSFPQDAAPLFESDEPLELTLAMPVRTIVSRMKNRPEVEGYVEYTGADGAPVRLDVEVRTRGRSRLEICSFPPLSINFKRGQVEGTLFAGQNRIKLVTLCKPSSNYEQYLHLEQLVYDVYRQITDYGFRTRSVNMRYMDTSRDDRVTEAPAFFIEHVDMLAERFGMRAAEVKSLDIGVHDPEALATYTLFQYLIGNLDWSAFQAPEGDECCHNTDILVPLDSDTPVIPVPYDFDMSGFLDADYATPNPQFRLRNVRQRLYRGLCSDNQYLEAAVQRFVAARPAIESVIASSAIDDDVREETLAYLNEGYEVLTTPASFQEEIIDKCRG